MDSYYQISSLKAEEMFKRLYIIYVDERGQDAGGLTREFFTLLSKEMFDLKKYSLFVFSSNGSTYNPNP